MAAERLPKILSGPAHSGLKSVPSDWGFRLPHSGPCSCEDAVWLRFHSSPVFYTLQIRSDGELEPRSVHRNWSHKKWSFQMVPLPHDDIEWWLFWLKLLSCFCNDLIWFRSSSTYVLMFYFGFFCSILLLQPGLTLLKLQQLVNILYAFKYPLIRYRF